MKSQPSVSVRMYDAGFGDAFLIKISDGKAHWKMLIDCGIHDQGREDGRLPDLVRGLISDLDDDKGNGPQVDVIVATHHHADHIAGFADPAWQEVEVGEVWLPFVEDEDPDSVKFRDNVAFTASRLTDMLSSPNLKDPEVRSSDRFSTASSLAQNSTRISGAADRLLGKNGSGFANQPVYRFLPSRVASENAIRTSISGATVHVLGPSRDPRYLKRTNPPSVAGWLTVEPDPDDEDSTRPVGDAPLFNGDFTMTEGDLIRDFSHFEGVRDQLGLGNLSKMKDILYAAAVLERAVDNTSLFLLLDVRGKRLLFPGDAEHGAWDHILENSRTREMIRNLALYKVSHHGSSNGTPQLYLQKYLGDRAFAMVPVGAVVGWDESIPDGDLLSTLAKDGHTVIRADKPLTGSEEIKSGEIKVKKGRWQQVKLLLD
jgi:beta-lactamase superfamily II metal-dependent hydrolase